jgi:hypothetical protein
MPYQAKSNGNGTYNVLRDGVVVVGGRIKRISFPSITTHRLEGAVHHIAGPCVATIHVPGVGDMEDIPVIF